MDINLLRIMYQQWCQGNDSYTTDWLMFVDIVVNHLRNDHAEIISELKKHSWFYWCEKNETYTKK